MLLAAFLAREHRSANPVIDPALFRDRRFTWGTAATIAVSVALYAILFVFPQYLQSVLGDGPASAGLRLLPMMGGLLVAGGAAGTAVRSAGTRLTVAAGLAVLAGGLVVLSQVHLTTGYAVVAAGLALCGLGTGASIGAAMDAVMAAAGGGEAGIGASVNSALRNTGGAITVAVAGSALSAGYVRALGPALAALPARDAAIARASVNQAVQHRPPPAIRRPGPAGRCGSRVPARHEQRHAHLRRRRRRRHPRQPAVPARPRRPRRRPVPAVSGHGGPRGAAARMTRASHVSLDEILTTIFAGFLIIAACIAAAAAASLFARGTPLTGMWASKESSYHELLRHRFVFGAGFILLAAALSFAAVGWIGGRRWGWVLSIVIIGANSLADLAQAAAAGDLAGSRPMAVDAIVLGWLLSGPVRRRFAGKRHRRPYPVAPGA